MQTEELIELVSDIRKIKSESQTLELKAAKINCPTKLFDTLSSFSNQDNGGIIIFGIDESNDYEICGVYDPRICKRGLPNNVSKWIRLYEHYLQCAV